MDRIELRGMSFRGRHGARPAEREHPQEFVVDLEVESDIRRPAETDQLSDAVDYTRLRAIAREVIEGPHANLLETLVTRIADGVLKERGVASVAVRVAKRPPSMQPIDAAAVHIKRTRGTSE